MSPTFTVSCTRTVGSGHLECSLNRWLLERCFCWSRILSKSSIGSCALVIWSRWNHISLADRPLDRSRLFSTDVETANEQEVTVSPRGSCRCNSASSSCMAFSATGLWFLFLILPTSTWIWYFHSNSLSLSAWNPGDGSTLTTARGPWDGVSSAHRHIIASRRS